nr:ATP-dependent DNA helicase PIF2 [Tanacetum cinerariifolium]
MFVTILLFCDVNRPLKLWEENWEALSEDILHKKRILFKYPELQLMVEQIQNYWLVEIQELLKRNGRNLLDFQDLSQPNPKLLTNMDNRLIREALAFDMHKRKLKHQQLHSQRYWENLPIQNYHFKTKIRTKDCTCPCSSWIASLLLPARKSTHSREIDTRKKDFNQWVLAVGDGKLHAKMKDGEDEPTLIEILEKFLINLAIHRLSRLL